MNTFGKWSTLYMGEHAKLTLSAMSQSIVVLLG